MASKVAARPPVVNSPSVIWPRFASPSALGEVHCIDILMFASVRYCCFELRSGRLMFAIIGACVVIYDFAVAAVAVATVEIVAVGAAVAVAAVVVVAASVVVCVTLCVVVYSFVYTSPFCVCSVCLNVSIACLRVCFVCVRRFVYLFVQLFVCAFVGRYVCQCVCCLCVYTFMCVHVFACVFVRLLACLSVCLLTVCLCMFLCLFARSFVCFLPKDTHVAVLMYSNAHIHRQCLELFRLFRYFASALIDHLCY